MLCEQISNLLYSIKNEKCLVKKQIPLKQLEGLLDHDDLQLELNIDDDNQHKELAVRFVFSLCEAGMVKDFKHEEEIEYEKKDFNGVSETAEISLKCLGLFFTKLQNIKLSNKIQQDILVPVIMLCAAHSKEFLWSSEQAVENACSVLSCILTFCHCSELKCLFHGLDEDEKHSHKGILKYLLKTLRPHLTKETWKKNPSFKCIFKWILRHLKHPFLSDHLSDVLPPSLLFIDHHLTYNKVLGIKCLHHIIENVPFTELKMYGRSDVVYDALHHLLYNSDPPIINVLYPCLLSFISCTERDSGHTYRLHQRSKYDEVYEQLLWNMEMEQRIILRKMYSAHMNKFIEKMGIKVVRHMKKTVRILIDYIRTYDEPDEATRINALVALQNLIRVSWPRIPFYCEDILKGLLCCMYDFDTADDNILFEIRNDVLSHCRECLLLLKAACPEKLVYITSLLVKEELPGLYILKEVISNQE